LVGLLVLLGTVSGSRAGVVFGSGIARQSGGH
jgi:hypothetical protein